MSTSTGFELSIKLVPIFISPILGFNPLTVPAEGLMLLSVHSLFPFCCWMHLNAPAGLWGTLKAASVASMSPQSYFPGSVTGSQTHIWLFKGLSVLHFGYFLQPLKQY